MEDKKGFNKKSFLTLTCIITLTLCEGFRNLKMIFTILVIYCGGLFNIGCIGAKYYELKIESPNPPRITRIIKGASYNAANARGNTDNFFLCPRKETIKNNLDQMIELFRRENVDVIALNEVDFNSIRTHNIDQAEYIAKGLGYKYIIKETMFSIPSILEMGNAVISRYPLKLNRSRQYGRGFSGRLSHLFKSFLDFDVLLDDSGRKLNFIFTHLDDKSGETRCDEIAILRSHLEKKTFPFVLLGDLNTGPGEESFLRLMETGLVSNPFVGLPTYPSDRPEDSIDHILVSSGLSIENYHTVSGIEASDHLPIIGDIILDQHVSDY
jgi:endonuclease/exonuclease/phosphatase family metal-dependent hydrolase